MNSTLLKALLGLVVLLCLGAWCIVDYRRERRWQALAQLIGAGCLVVTVLTHVAEAVHLFPAMHWGSPHSAGHYLDLSSAWLGLVLSALGFASRLITRLIPLRSSP